MGAVKNFRIPLEVSKKVPKKQNSGNVSVFVCVLCYSLSFSHQENCETSDLEPFVTLHVLDINNENEFIF